MECSCFTIKALTTVALLFFAYNVTSHTAVAMKFVWSVECTDEDNAFEDLNTEQFPLPEKCPTPPPYEPQPPPYENN